MSCDCIYLLIDANIYAKKPREAWLVSDVDVIVSLLLKEVGQVAPLTGHRRAGDVQALPGPITCMKCTFVKKKERKSKEKGTLPEKQSFLNIALRARSTRLDS